MAVNLSRGIAVRLRYIKFCRELIQRNYPEGFETINPVSYRTGRFGVVHLTHPSKGNGTIDAWLNADVVSPDESSRKRASARKREQAIQAIKGFGVTVES